MFPESVAVDGRGRGIVSDNPSQGKSWSVRVLADDQRVGDTGDRGADDRREDEDPELCEVVMTAVFLIVILGSTAKRAAGGFAGMAIGLCLTLIHLISIPVTNTSVNPARSTGPALFGPSYAVSELWLFWVAPIVGAIIGAVIYRTVLSNGNDD